MLEGRPILGETYNHMHFLFTGRWFYEWHGAGGGGLFISGRWGEGGLIIGCLRYMSCYARLLTLQTESQSFSAS